MKTGILTYHNTRNCGALLQAYALQKTLFHLGIDNDVIDYHCAKIEGAYKIKRIHEIQSLKELVKWILTVRTARKSQTKFDAFKAQYLKLSRPYLRDTIIEANDSYDTFITGSDQVWNFNLNGSDYTYVLDFAHDDKIKLSYAASMGSKSIEKGNEEKFTQELLKFHGVSVREKPLKEYVDGILNIDSELVLDPTLLLEKEDYDFGKSSRIIDEKYIFVYTIASTPNIEKAAKILSKETGYPIVWGHMSYKKKKGVLNKTDISPDEFINYIQNAEYVLTSSFHGMALSIVLEKQFFYDLDIKKQNNNSRLETLAEVLDLESQKIDDAYFASQAREKINYQQLHPKFEKLKEKSLSFLIDHKQG